MVNNVKMSNEPFHLSPIWSGKLFTKFSFPKRK